MDSIATFEKNFANFSLTPTPGAASDPFPFVLTNAQGGMGECVLARVVYNVAQSIKLGNSVLERGRRGGGFKLGSEACWCCVYLPPPIDPPASAAPPLCRLVVR